VLFPAYFRLSSHTDRRYRLFLEGPLPTGAQGPAGPAGPAGAQGPAGPGVVDFDTAEVTTNVDWIDGADVKCIVIDMYSDLAGLNNSEITKAHNIAGSILVIQIAGFIQDSSNQTTYTLPHVDTGVASSPMPSAEIYLQAGRIRIASTGDWTAFTECFVILWYISL
jgi:hypothetical protein